MVTGVFELIAVQAKPHQPDPEGEQLIVTAGLSHDGATLGNGLGGDGEAQVHIGGHLPGMEGGVEAPPFHRSPVEHCLFAGFCVFDPNAESEEGHGDQVDEYDAATVKAVGHYLKISAADHKDWWATRWYLPAGEQKPNDSVPNFKIMNDAAIALADKECRSEFVSLCVRNIEEMVERVLAIPE